MNDLLITTFLDFWDSCLFLLFLSKISVVKLKLSHLIFLSLFLCSIRNIVIVRIDMLWFNTPTVPFLNLLFYIFLLFYLTNPFYINLYLKFFYLGIYLVLTLTIEAFTMWIQQSFNDIFVLNLITGQIFICFIKLVIILFWMAIPEKIFRKKLQMRFVLPKKIMLLVLSAPFTSIIFLSYVLYGVYIKSYKFNILIFCLTILVIILNILTLITLIYIIRFYNQIVNNNAIKFFHENQKKYWRKLEKLELNLKTQRHDLKNTYNLLLSYIETQDIEKANQLIKRNLNIIDSITPTFYTVNASLNIFLSYKFSLVKSLNIVTSVKIFLGDSNTISDDFLVGLLGNLIDNSINACRKLPFDNRKIDLYIKYFNRTFYLRISNPVPDSSQNIHEGIGISSIKNIVNKEGGIYENHIEDGEYIVVIIIWETELGGK